MSDWFDDEAIPKSQRQSGSLWESTYDGAGLYLQPGRPNRSSASKGALLQLKSFPGLDFANPVFSTVLTIIAIRENTWLWTCARNKKVRAQKYTRKEITFSSHDAHFVEDILDRIEWIRLARQLSSSYRHICVPCKQTTSNRYTIAKLHALFIQCTQTSCE